MKDFETGIARIRSVARKHNVIADSDNDDTLIERVVGIIKDHAKAKAQAKAEAPLEVEVVEAEVEPEKPLDKPPVFL